MPCKFANECASRARNPLLHRAAHGDGEYLSQFPTLVSLFPLGILSETSLSMVIFSGENPALHVNCRFSANSFQRPFFFLLPPGSAPPTAIRELQWTSGRSQVQSTTRMKCSGQSLAHTKCLECGSYLELPSEQLMLLPPELFHYETITSRREELPQSPLSLLGQIALDLVKKRSPVHAC